MKKRSRQLFAVAVVGSVLSLPTASQAYFTSFDFEDTDVVSGQSPIVLSDDMSGQVLSITQPGSSPSIVDFSAASATITLGSRTLIPGDGGALILNFTKAIEQFSVQAGDFGDDLDTFELIAYSGPDGTGDVVATNSGVQLPPVGDLFSSQILELTASGAVIQSISLFGGSDATNSVAYDNIAVAVPLPPVLFAAAPVLLGAMAIVNRKRRLGA